MLCLLVFITLGLRGETIPLPVDMPITQQEVAGELNTKLLRVREFLEQQRLAGVLLTRVENVSWVTAGLGDNHIVITSEDGSPSLLIMRDGSRYVIGEQSEVSRMLKEDLVGLGYKPLKYSWYEDKTVPDRRLQILHQLSAGGQIGTDDPYEGLRMVGEQFAPLRYQLTDSEIRKYRLAAHDTSEAVIAVCKKIVLGMTEREIETITSNELMKRKLRPTVLLIGVDRRVVEFYHHTPSDLPLRRYAIVNVCARRWGLVVSVARFVHFGPVDPELRRKEQAAMQISARFENSSKPGVTAGEMLEMAKRWYREQGFDGGWQDHHQGGAIGYAEREWIAVPGSKEVIHDHQAFAWNPILHGTLSFDTVVVFKDHVENLTRTPDWPTKPIDIDGITYWMPDILIRAGRGGEE
jgi:Xaa-Pro dipeptidase